MFSISQPHRELTITSRCTVDLTPAGTPKLQLSPPWEEVREQARRRVLADDFDAAQFVFESPLVTLGKSFAAYAAPSFAAGRPLLDAANDLSRRIYEEFQYDKRATTISTPIDEVLETRHGVCQDFAHLMIACLRSLELPVRYISGYLRNDANLTGAEASHAWVSVWCPVLGWQGFDPDQQHDAGRTSRHLGVGPRLFRCDSGEGCGAGRRRARHQRVGGRFSARRALNQAALAASRNFEKILTRQTLSCNPHTSKSVLKKYRSGLIAGILTAWLLSVSSCNLGG